MIKNDMIKIFNCTKYRIHLARKWRDSNQGKGLCIPEKKKFGRHRLDLNKSEHFLNFIFSSGMVLDVAYGVTKIKYDSGEEQKVPHAILTIEFSHAIAFYTESCKIADFSPLPESSLWKILHATEPSQRKSLAGLANITASGMNTHLKVQNITLKHVTNIAVIITTAVWLPTPPNLHFLIQMNKISKNNLLHQTESAKNIVFCVKQLKKFRI